MLTVSGLEVAYGGRPVVVGLDLDVGDGEASPSWAPTAAGRRHWPGR